MIRLSSVSAPVPPSLIAKVPIIELAAKSIANLLFSITRPPSAFVSIDNVCSDFSTFPPVVAKPFPVVIVETKFPVVWSPNEIRLARVLAPVPPSFTANVPVIELASKLIANLLFSIISPPSIFASIDNAWIELLVLAPVVDKPSPALILETYVPTVCCPSVIESSKVVFPVPPLLAGSTLFNKVADKSIIACLFVSNIMPPSVFAFIDNLLPFCIKPSSGFNCPELVNFVKMISVVLIVITESLLHTKLVPPFVSPLSIKIKAPLLSLLWLKSVDLLQVLEEHIYIPFSLWVDWFLTNILLPISKLTPSTICVPDKLEILVVVATFAESLKTRPVEIPST